jgi:NADH:ubiquinone oxidoreductase subunit 4 (subunit M)
LFLPLVGALLLFLIPREQKTLHRGIGLAFSLFAFAVSLVVLAVFKNDADGYQLVVDKV